MRLVALATTVALASCSFTFAHTPPVTQSGERECGANYAWFGLDAALFLALIAGAVELNQGKVVTDLLLIGSLPFAASTIYGVAKGIQCPLLRGGW